MGGSELKCTGCLVGGIRPLLAATMSCRPKPRLALSSRIRTTAFSPSAVNRAMQHGRGRWTFARLMRPTGLPSRAMPERPSRSRLRRWSLGWARAPEDKQVRMSRSAYRRCQESRKSRASPYCEAAIVSGRVDSAVDSKCQCRTLRPIFSGTSCSAAHAAHSHGHCPKAWPRHPP